MSLQSSDPMPRLLRDMDSGSTHVRRTTLLKKELLNLESNT
jgi:hypothetical protein